MRIESIRIDGFGRLRDVSLELGEGVNLIYGTNEAGKSSLHGFIRAMLFGFPPRSRMPERYEPERGGPHGGRLVLIDGRGGRLRLERHAAAGSSAGKLRVVLDDGSEADEALLHDRLGGLTAEQFRHIFAFGLGELQELKALQSDELHALLFHAGTGTAAMRLMEAGKRLRRDKERLYKPRGQNPPLNRELSRLRELRKEWHASLEQSGQFNTLQEQYVRMGETSEQLDRKWVAARERAVWLKQCLEARETWLRRKQLHRELETLPSEGPLPVDAEERFLRWRDELERAEEEGLRLAEKQRRLDERASAMTVHEELLDRKHALDDCLRELAFAAESRRRADRLQADIEQTDRELAAWAKQVDPAWQVSTLVSWDVSTAAKGRVTRFQERFAALDRALERLDDQSLMASQAASTQQRAADTVLRQALWGFLGATVLLPSWLWWMNHNAPAAAGALVILLLADLYIYFTLRKSRSAIGEDGAEVAAAQERAHRQEEKAQLVQEWEDWLLTVSLHPPIRVETVRELFHTVEKAQSMWGYRQRQHAEREAIIRELQRIETRAVELLEQWSHLQEGPDFLKNAASRPDGSRLESAVRFCREEVDRQAALLEERRGLERQSKEVREELEVLQARKIRLMDAIRGLWHEAGVGNETEFMEKLQRQKHRRALEEEIRQLEVELEHRVGASRLDALMELFEHSTWEDLSREEEQVRALAEQVADQLGTLREERGRLRHEMDQWILGERHAELLQLVREQEERVHRLTGQWAILTTALELLDRARALYEKERQPAVLKRASRYLAELTEGRYVRVLAPLGEIRILAGKPDGETVDPAYLSRGTAEQLYLAIRLALAVEQGSRADGHLPLILDDILVNFDDSRMRQALKLLLALGKDRQILLFTCHPHIRAAIRELSGNVREIQLSYS